jgi:hypothetical protein
LSDERLKKNIKPLAGALDALLQLKGVTFDWKDPEKQLGERDRGPQIGFIAQDVQKAFPAWVQENSDGFKTLDIPAKQITALTVESIRTLKTENDALKVKVDKQQTQIDKLQAAIDEIKHGKDPISRGPGFGTGVLALFAAGFAGATGLMLKRMGFSLATAVGLLLAGRKKKDVGRP